MTAIATEKKKIYTSWENMEMMISSAIHDILHDSDGNERKLPTGVYGLPRGGLVLATIISNRLNIPMLMAPCEGCIVVDDLADSGVTLKHFADCGYEIFTWGYKEKSIVKPTWYYDTFGEDEWVVFPWEA